MKEQRKTPKLRFPEFTGDWEQRKLGDVAEYRNGKAHENEIDDNGEYIVVNSKFVSTNGEIKKFSNVQNEPLYENEIAFVLSDVPNGRAIARTFLIDKSGKYTLNQRIAGITPHEDTDPYYLHIKMNRNAYFLKFDDGNKQTNLSIKDVLNYEDMYPTYKEQQKIGNYFRNLDHLITLHQRKCDAIKELKKGMLQKMFPKNGEKIPEVRFPGFTDDWEQRKLDDVVEFLDTMRKPLEGAKRISGPYPYYGASGIVDYVDGYLFDEELILLSEDGANITDRNYPVCFLASGKYWVNNHAHVLRTKQGNENNFICNSLERKDYTQYNTGMAMPKLNKETCKKIPILCPGFEEQKKIGDYFRSLDHLITLHQRKVEKLKEMKKGLLQQMFV